MSTNKKSGAGHPAVWLVTIAVGLAGCGPPGPEALMQGEQLIKQGHYQEAVASLKKATALLPKNAQAWNHLGLAHHGNRQPEEAARAYQNALSLDHKLAVVHYNLGCLYLEQNNLEGATNELMTYTFVQKSHVEGWLKFGVAQIRAKRLDAAEQCFKTALERQPSHPEALNDLGVIQFQRRRWQDAHNYFNLALHKDPNYGPAQLNIAVINHQALNNRGVALKQYRTYLASQPHGPDWEAVDAIARQLDEELNPPALVVRPVPTNPPPPTSVRTSVVAAAAAATPSRPTVNTPLVVAARTNPAPAANPPRAHTGPTNRPAVAVRPPPEPPRAASSPPPRSAEIPATAISDDLVVKPAQDLSARTPSAAAKAASAPAPSSSPTNPGQDTETKSDPAKRSLISRLNPFSRKPKESEAGKASPAGTNVLVAHASLPPATPVETLSSSAPVPRYPYQSSAAPRPGNRAQAQPAFDRGVKAHKAGKPAQAIEEYQNALRADPAYFDACYNLGVAADDTGDLGLALIAYETALAIKSDSNARYNFALALKASGYPHDAADQLKKLLATNPNEARVHLSLANLGAQQLHQPALAREHYTRVLELNPNHPEAGKIRAWLANNP